MFLFLKMFYLVTSFMNEPKTKYDMYKLMKEKPFRRYNFVYFKMFIIVQFELIFALIQKTITFDQNLTLLPFISQFNILIF